MKDGRQQQIKAEAEMYLLGVDLWNEKILTLGQVRTTPNKDKRYIVLEHFNETLITKVLNLTTLEYDYVDTVYLLDSCAIVDTWSDGVE